MSTSQHNSLMGFVLCHRGYFKLSIANKCNCFFQVLKMDLQEDCLGGGGGGGGEGEVFGLKR